MSNIKPILIIGESFQDSYSYCDSKRLRFSPEAPVPVLKITETISTIGGAGNTARNAKALGFPHKLVTNENWKEISKRRIVCKDSNHHFCRIDSEDTVERIKGLDEIQWNDYSAVVISDYCKSYLSDLDIHQISLCHPLTFLDTKRPLGGFANKITFIKLNAKEYEDTEKTITPTLADKIIITMGSKGAKFRDKAYPVEEVEVKDVAGLGDLFHISCCIAYIKTGDINISINYANAACTMAAQKRGTSVLEPDEVEKLNNAFNL